MNAHRAEAWFRRLGRALLRLIGRRPHRHAAVRDPLPAGIQIRLESQGLLYIEPRAAGGGKSDA